MSINAKEKKKLHRWNNPDIYIGFSFFFYFSLLFLLLASPPLMERLHVKAHTLQIILLLFLFAGALFSGIGNWLGLGHKPDPDDTDEIAQDVLKQLDERLKDRRLELSDEKPSSP